MPRETRRSSRRPTAGPISPVPSIGAPAVAANFGGVPSFQRSNVDQADSFFQAIGAAGGVARGIADEMLAQEIKQLQTQGALDAYKAATLNTPEAKKAAKLVNSDAYQSAFMEQFGRLQADKLATTLASQVEQQRNQITDPAQVAEMYAQAAEEHFADTDPNYVSGFAPLFASAQAKALMQFTAFNDERIYEQGVEQHYSDTASRVTEAVDRGASTDELYAVLEAARLDGKQFHGLNNQEINEAQVSTVLQLALERQDESLLDVFNLPGASGAAPLANSKHWDQKIRATRAQIQRATASSRVEANNQAKFIALRQAEELSKIGQYTARDAFNHVEQGVLTPAQASKFVDDSNTFIRNEAMSAEILNDLNAGDGRVWMKHPDNPELVEQTFNQQASMILMTSPDPALAIESVAGMGAMNNLVYEPLKLQISNGARSGQQGAFQQAYDKFTALRNKYPSYAMSYVDDRALENFNLYEHRLQVFGESDAEAIKYVQRAAAEFGENASKMPKAIRDELEQQLGDNWSNDRSFGMLRQAAYRYTGLGMEPDEAIKAAQKQISQQYGELPGGQHIHRTNLPDNWQESLEWFSEMEIPEITGGYTGNVYFERPRGADTDGRVFVTDDNWEPLFTPDGKRVYVDLKQIGVEYSNYKAQQAAERFKLRKQYGASAGRRKQSRR